MSREGHAALLDQRVGERVEVLLLFPGHHAVIKSIHNSNTSYIANIQQLYSPYIKVAQSIYTADAWSMNHHAFITQLYIHVLYIYTLYIHIHLHILYIYIYVKYTYIVKGHDALLECLFLERVELQGFQIQSSGLRGLRFRPWLSGKSPLSLLALAFRQKC